MIGTARSAAIEMTTSTMPPTAGTRSATLTIAAPTATVEARATIICSRSVASGLSMSV